MTLHVVAHFHARPGQGAEMRPVLELAVAPTAAEDGCISYRLARDVEDDDHFVFLEEWRDRPALDAHLGASHVTAMLAAVDALLAGPITSYRLSL